MELPEPGVKLRRKSHDMAILHSSEESDWRTPPSVFEATAPIYIIMPILGARDYTVAAIADCLAQSVPTRLLLVNQGVDDPFRDELERIAEAHADRILLWSHVPPLTSLAATWNRALDFVWEAGGEEALVVNNDVRLPRETAALLQQQLRRQAALFVSGVGVAPEQFNPQQDFTGADWSQHGGPDFSCFLISRDCHAEFRFDEAYIPAYGEDIDMHRRFLLAGQGHRIFSVNLPYLHYGSATLKEATAEKRAGIERAISSGSRRHHEAKWGGPVNQETYLMPWGMPDGLLTVGGEIQRVTDGTATTPWLQAHPPQLVVLEGVR